MLQKKTIELSNIIVSAIWWWGLSMLRTPVLKITLPNFVQVYINTGIRHIIRLLFVVILVLNKLTSDKEYIIS